MIASLTLQVPFTVLTFVDKSYKLSDADNISISRIEAMARREYLKSFVPFNGIDACSNSVRLNNSRVYCYERYQLFQCSLSSNDSVVYGTGKICPSAYSMSADFSNQQQTFCFANNYTTTVCHVDGLTLCYNHSTAGYPLHNITV